MATKFTAGTVINAGAVIVGVDADAPPATPSAPIIQNYFQASLSDWTIVAGSVTQPTSGTFAWTRSGGSGWVAGYEISGLTAGTEYTISYEIRNPNGGSTIDALVSTVLAGGTWLSRQNTQSSDFVTFTSTWTQPNQTTAYLNILSDNEGQSGEIRSVSIVALISNEPPVISGIDASYTLTEGQDTVVTAVGTDPESDAITWSYNISGSTGSISASDFTLTGMYNNNLGTSENGLAITIGGGGSQWVSYQNLPTYLTGLLCTTGINEGESLSFTIPACTVYMLRSSNWDGVDTTGWELIESGTDYMSSVSNLEVYSKEFSAGTYNFDNQSAMYMFAGETIDMTVSQTDNVFTITPGTTDISTQITFTATDIEGNATSVSSDITFATPAPAPAPAPELDPDTIASLHINGTDSGIVDSSTNSYSVTLHDNVSVIDVSPYSTGKSMTFDGNGDMVSATVDNGVGAVEFTVEFWMYRESDTGFIFNNRTGGENTDGFDIRSDLDITTAGNRFFSGRSLENNRWYHVALTRDSSYLTRLFIDGVNVGTSTVSNAFTGSSVYIGGSPHGNVGYFNGKIADFRIVTGEAVYIENFSAPTSPLGVTETPAPAPAPDTIASLHINGTDSGIVDISPNSYSVNSYGDVSVVDVSPYSTGKSMTFDGNGDYLNVPSEMNFGTEDFTFEGWYYLTGDRATFLSGSQNGSYDFVYVSNSIRIGRVNTAWDQIINHTLTQNTWQHISFVRSSGTLSVYVDGNLIGAETNDNNYFSGSTVWIGQNFLDGGDGRSFSGNMSDVRIVTGEAVYTENFSVPTSPLGVTETPASTPSIVTEGLVFYVDASDTSSYSGTGTTLSDLSGNGNTGTLTNGVGFTADEGGSLIFDGVDDFVDFGVIDFTSETSITVEVWVKPNSSQKAYADILDYGHDVGGFTIQQNASSTNQYYFAYSNGSGYDVTPTITLDPNSFNHLVFVKSGTSTICYLNSVNSIEYTGSPNFTGSGIAFNLGRRQQQSGREFNGNIASTRIYNRALSATEIAQNYNLGHDQLN